MDDNGMVGKQRKEERKRQEAMEGVEKEIDNDGSGVQGRERRRKMEWVGRRMKKRERGEDKKGIKGDARG